ncbi:sensor histidine kinase [Hyphomicrobium sp.]|uniref:HAMP domain-containing sensor histidine kinase n=1 Tax=Hyphomicrobium sp. TaxID=82 RepID=UPI000FC2F689|nr:sensor histidine kinase [Hyphomicrobium sp.]RUP10895.1 MAG: sensor histidine kinase [Hyphomicrobium sp.]
MNLKWLLVRRITLVALACFLTGSAFVLYETVREAKGHNSALAELVGRQLELQLSRIDRSTDIAKRFPDWDIITTYSLLPGQCVELSGHDGKTQRSSCGGMDNASVTTPKWFLQAYRTFVGGNLDAVWPVSYRGVSHGTVAASLNPAETAAQAWSTIAPLMLLSAVLVEALCLVTYMIVVRALQPAEEILSGLNRLARGDLGCRLPAFRLSEFNRISEVFNALTDELGKVTSERADLAGRLVDTQEQERRHIARELHDEIAQKLAALNALAASIRTVAQRDAPELVAEARQLEEMASGAMKSLRRTLTYLRPQEIDDLGLIQSLKDLVDQHNKISFGRTRFSFETTAEMEQLRAETSAHVYRIIQEALTNASKHANARNVTVQLNRLPDADPVRIRLSVVDDGVGRDGDERGSRALGWGLIGMRERVLALSGKFAAGPLPSGGFGLQVEFPTALRSA